MRIKKLTNKKKTIEELAAENVSGKFSLTEIIALKVVRVGTDEINFKILEMLPSDINTMMKEVNLTKVPVNVRINELEKVGLVERFKGTGKVVLTDFGRFFIDAIKSYEGLVRENLMKVISACVGQ